MTTIGEGEIEKNPEIAETPEHYFGNLAAIARGVCRFIKKKDEFDRSKAFADLLKYASGLLTTTLTYPLDERKMIENFCSIACKTPYSDHSEIATITRSLEECYTQVDPLVREPQSKEQIQDIFEMPVAQ
jgi:hypothetical protein